VKKAVILMSAVAIAGVAQAKKAETLDPNAAYVLVEVQHLESPMLKGTKMPGMVTLARYDAARGDVRGGDKARESALPEKVLPRITLDKNPSAKTKTGRQFLVKVDPDTWVIEGVNGTSFSLGGATFVVRPGEVVDLGVMKPSVDWLEGEGPKSMMGGIMGAALFGSARPKETRPNRLELRARAAGDMPLPVSLTGRTLTPAEFSQGAKFGNYLGGLVNRIGGRASRPGTDPQAPTVAQ
jgi:hypothetical protein